MKKLLLALICFGTYSLNATAQLSKMWDYRFGGSVIDEFHDVISIFDTNSIDGRAYLLGGYSESGINGDKSIASYGSGDFWLINLSTSGIKHWDKAYGGSGYDELFEVQQCADGGFIMGGWSNSPISGTKSQASFGAGDYWVVRTDLNGNVLWDKTFGGAQEDYLQAVKQTSDGGFILAGRSNSGISGNKSQANRGTVGVTWDYWVVKINASGIKQWDKTLGGFDDDQCFSVQETSDGGFIVGGYSGSGITGDKTQANVGFDDYWIVKLDVLGAKQWDKTFGGSNPDQLQLVIETSDGGFLLGGASASGANGDKSEPSRGNFDYWILKTNASGTKQWDHRFGGSSADYLFDLIETSDNGFLLGGASSSAAGGDKKEGNRGTVGSTYDYWIVKVDANGIAQVDRRYGGTADDYAKSIAATNDGNYIVAGWSTSGIGGDKTEASRGSIDYWVAKVSGPNSITTNSMASPSCAGTNVLINFTTTGTFNAGNTFTAYLSDSSGSFASPTNIGTFSSTSGGSFFGTLPMVVAGMNYKVMVVSDNPVANDIYPSSSFQIDYPQAYYVDSDNDGYGTGFFLPTLSCDPIPGRVTNNLDCDDNDSLVHSSPFGNDGATALSSNCQGSSGNIFNCFLIDQATSYQWILSSGLSSAFPGNITTNPSISISISTSAVDDSVGVAGVNSCGVSDTVYYRFVPSPLPDAAASIIGNAQVASCANQLGISYSISPINNASNYSWTLPIGATVIGNADTTDIHVDFPTYGQSGTISVEGVNSCGAGLASFLNIDFKPIPTAEICGITVDEASQKGVIKWQRPMESYADSIVILRKDLATNKFERIAAVENVSQGSYTDLTGQSTPDLNAETYKLVVKDSCGFVGDTSVAVSHRTIFLYGYTGWNNVAKLYWNEYIGSNDSINYYRILRDFTGSGPLLPIDSIASNLSLNYTDTALAASNCPTCRYAIEMVFGTDCNANARMNALYKSTTRSNIKNKTAMPFDSTLVNLGQIKALNTHFNLFPNPSQLDFTLTSFKTSDKVQLEMFDLIGNKVYTYYWYAIHNGDKLKLDLPDLAKGIYLLKLIDKQGTDLIRLVKN